MRRLHAVEALQERIAAEINQALVDTTQEVLVENQKDGVLTGRTRSNKLVHWHGDASPGDLVNVRITRASPWALRGAQAEAVVTA
jgi:tRNA-2-methylthio-N6-dimethylallyladenosine synthase